MTFHHEFTYVTTLRLDQEERALLDSLVERERVPKNQLFRQGLRLLGDGAELPPMKPPQAKPTITVRLEAPDEKILLTLFEQRGIPKETLLRGGIRALAREKGVRAPKRRGKKASAA